MINILLLEDDIILQEIIEEYLVEKGYSVDSFDSGDDALSAIENKKYHMLLLDINVPEVDGFEIVEYLRSIKNKTPVIFITSLINIKYLKKAFDIGANDYLKKPFDLEELEIRIKHHLNLINDEIKLNNFSFYPKKNLVIKDNKEYNLKQKETQILLYFIQNKESIISTQELIENIWTNNNIPTDATIRTYIKNLRKILGNDAFRNIKGLGYRLNII